MSYIGKMFPSSSVTFE